MPEAAPTRLEPLLDRVCEARTEEGAVSLDAILDEVGRRSFGPLLLVAGLVTLAPLVGDIPGVPTAMGVFVVLTAAQLLAGRDHLWLPDWLLRRSVGRDKVEKGVSWMRKPARWIDRVLRPRISFLVEGPGLWIVAIASLVVGLGMPPMELVPFSANIAGLALTAFGLALITKDGLLGDRRAAGHGRGLLRGDPRLAVTRRAGPPPRGLGALPDR